jgi:hypothetical protein
MTVEHSQNGWVASKDKEAIKIKHFPVAGTKIKLQCNEICGPVLAAFAAEFHVNVEPLEEGVFDDWSYAYRNVRNKPDDLSNHSSGTAIDLNAVKHPLGKEDTFTEKQRKVLDILCKKYGLRGGYTYKGRKDDMHFEIVETPEQVKARVIKMKLK